MNIFNTDFWTSQIKFFYIGKSKKNQKIFGNIQNSANHTLKQSTACRLHPTKKIKKFSYSLFSVRPSKKNMPATFFHKGKKEATAAKLEPATFGFIPYRSTDWAMRSSEHGGIFLYYIVEIFRKTSKKERLQRWFLYTYRRRVGTCRDETEAQSVEFFLRWNLTFFELEWP